MRDKLKKELLEIDEKLEDLKERTLSLQSRRKTVVENLTGY